METTILVEV